LNGTGDIRPLRPSDRQPLRDLLARTGMFSPEEVGIALELIDTVLQVPGQKDYLINVLEQEGKVAGYYCVGPTPATAGTYDMYWIAVDPSVQGNGAGTRLNTHAEELIASRGGRLIVVETSSRQQYTPTRTFYERRGYTETARIRGYYRPDDDLVVYCKYLTP
jgi:ribosomal protein S18 acetylase RimI-like enzyme